MTFSFEGKIVAAALLALLLVSAPAAWLAARMEPWWLAWCLCLIPAIIILVLLLRRLLRPTEQLFAALGDAVSSLKDSDFSVSLAEDRDDELGELVRAYNELGDVLRTERQSLYQRELLLDTVMQSAPTALVLCNANDRIVYCNTAARHLFADGKPLNGHAFAEILATRDAAFSQAVAAGLSGLFTVERDEEPDTYHLAHSQFTLNAQPHQLYLFKQLTHEISRQEVSTWKKVIRLISHELNNSLAPISSLAHSGRLISQTPNIQKLDSIFNTIEDRADHLKRFIEGYARFARLPAPRIESVQWPSFVASLQQVKSFQIDGSLPEQPGHFDPGQMEQVLINLVKNAHESGSPPEQVLLKVIALNGWHIQLADRGPGMPDSVLANALLPFYSTKQSGTGLGLPLCREIVEAHGGRLSLSNRQGGGLKVSIWLPPTE